jgi:hypothetical protein
MTDDNELRDLWVDLSLERFEKADGSISRAFGAENAPRGRAIADKCLPALTKAIATYAPRQGSRGQLRAFLGQFLAEAILSPAIRACCDLADFDLDDDDDDDRDRTLGATVEQIGENLKRVCRADWDAQATWEAGSWATDVLVTTLPGMFEVVEVPVEGGKPYEFEYYLVFAPGAEQIGDAELWRCIRSDPHHLPSFEPPEPWRGDYREGAYGERQKLIRGRRVPLIADELEAMRPALEGLHRLEAVAYRVN